MFAARRRRSSDGVITLPKGARVISTSASAGRVAVLLDVDGANELRTFDIKTLKQTGRLRFTTGAVTGARRACTAVPSRLFPRQAPFV